MYYLSNYSDSIVKDYYSPVYTKKIKEEIIPGYASLRNYHKKNKKKNREKLLKLIGLSKNKKSL